MPWLNMISHSLSQLTVTHLTRAWKRYRWVTGTSSAAALSIGNLFLSLYDVLARARPLIHPFACPEDIFLRGWVSRILYKPTWSTSKLYRWTSAYYSKFYILQQHIKVKKYHFQIFWKVERELSNYYFSWKETHCMQYESFLLDYFCSRT